MLEIVLSISLFSISLCSHFLKRKLKVDGVKGIIIMATIFEPSLAECKTLCWILTEVSGG